jgi:hypothetical protein
VMSAYSFTGYLLRSSVPVSDLRISDGSSD